MTKRKYSILIIGLVGGVLTWEYFATTCNPLTYSEITQIVHIKFNPACYVKSFKVESEELPFPRQGDIGIITSSEGTASDTGVSFSPSAEIPEVS